MRKPAVWPPSCTRGATLRAAPAVRGAPRGVQTVSTLPCSTHLEQHGHGGGVPVVAHNHGVLPRHEGQGLRHRCRRGRGKGKEANQREHWPRVQGRLWTETTAAAAASAKRGGAGAAGAAAAAAHTFMASRAARQNMVKRFWLSTARMRVVWVGSRREQGCVTVATGSAARAQLHTEARTRAPDAAARCARLWDQTC